MHILKLPRVRLAVFLYTGFCLLICSLSLEAVKSPTKTVHGICMLRTDLCPKKFANEKIKKKIF